MLWGWCWDLSLNCVIRSSSPCGATDARIQQSSVCSGTSDWMNSVALSGSMPQARSSMAIARARPGISAGSYGCVIAW